jgi:hypothetical protein
MKCVSGSDPHTLVFQFVDATNMRSLDDPHMHGLSLEIVGPNRIRTRWQRYEDGRPAGQATFDLMRISTR